MDDTPATPPPVHFVYEDDHCRYASLTLTISDLALVNAVTTRPRSRRPWRRGRGDAPTVEGRLLDLLGGAAPGGLIVLGSDLNLAPPPPFAHPFEPIELGANDAELQTLSGADERGDRRPLWGLGAVAAALGLAFLVWIGDLGNVGKALRRGLPAFLAVAFAILASISLRTIFHPAATRWFLVPGGVYIAHRRTARLHSRSTSVLSLRFVRSGKTSVRVAELWTREAQILRRSVSEREALALLAAWQCTAPTPSLHDLQSLDCA